MNLKKLWCIIGKLQQLNKNKMKISQEGLALIKKYEGCELNAYVCPAGVLTIGYGHTKNVKEGDTITQEEANDMLIGEMCEYEDYVNGLVKVDLEQYQFDSLCSWVYNLGPTNLITSTLLEVLNNKDYEGVPTQIKRWNKSNGEVLEGLVKRREAEALLFENKPWENV